MDQEVLMLVWHVVKFSVSSEEQITNTRSITLIERIVSLFLFIKTQIYFTHIQCLSHQLVYSYCKLLMMTSRKPDFSKP
jgi:hypothetical protein